MNKILLILSLIYGCAQAQTVDSVFVDHRNQISLRCSTTYTAGIVKAGDTLSGFATTDVMKIGYDTIVHKGANVIAVVKTSTTEHKVAKEDRALEEGFIQMKSGGMLQIEYLAVMAVDGSYIPLGDCSFLRYGGDNGGLPKGTPAFIPTGTFKSCNIKFPGKKVAVLRPSK